MKRFLGHALSVIVIGLATAAALPACVENDSSIFIHHVLAPPATRQNNVCTYQPDPLAPGLFEGTLDIGIRDTYFAAMIVGSQLMQRGDPQQVRAESNRSHVNGAIVRVEGTDGAVFGEFTSSATGFADTGVSNQPSYSVIGATLIDAPTKDAIAGTIGPGGTKLVIAFVKVFGETLGGVDVESGEFQFPIRVCNGCLVTFPTDDPATPVRECNAPTDQQASQSLPCYAGQDELTPCFVCNATKEVCQR